VRSTSGRGALRGSYNPRQPAEEETLTESKEHVSLLNRVGTYSRPEWLTRERLLRSERVAARNRIGFRRRVHRRELKSVMEGLPGQAIKISHKTNVQPVTQTSPGVDSFRRERVDDKGDSSERQTEDLETGNDTMQE
jgi:hypothetical protein